MVDQNEIAVIEYLRAHPERSSKEIFEYAATSLSYATVKRLLAKLVMENYVVTSGKGKSTKYLISPAYELLQPIDQEAYYSKEIDDRSIKEQFDFILIKETLHQFSLFTNSELARLQALQDSYLHNISGLTASEYTKELERLAIDLSWKSSQIEGNTYSLLETEKLLKENETASGKTKEEASMLINHKDAIDFIVENPDYINPLSLRSIEDIHSILVKELVIERNLRKRRVGISGTNYKPLDNEHQIREALEDMCQLINAKDNVFEKALLALVLISYIQPFMDGNKRTARIISNAILMHNRYCPLSFRTIDSIEYKKAMLLFYEQNNISSFKAIFMDQFEFAVKTYF